MATDIQKLNSTSSKNFRYKVRTPYLNFSRHINDNYTNLGYDYRGKILKKMTSPELWANPMQNQIIYQIEAMINFIIEQVKYIKKTFSIAHEKNSMNIN